MTRKEKLDWLYRLKSEIYVYMPKEWLIPMNNALDMAINVLNQQKEGHWIKYGRPMCGEQHYKCTSCEYYINFGQWGEVYTKQFKYCPNCGAKMRGEI